MSIETIEELHNIALRTGAERRRLSTSQKRAMMGQLKPCGDRDGILINDCMLWHDWKREEYAFPNASRADISAPTSVTVQDTHHVHDPASKSGILQMPYDILHLIVRHLDIESELSLRFSCTHLYLNSGPEPTFSMIYKMRISTDPAVRMTWLLLSEWLPVFSWRSVKSLFCAECGDQHSWGVFHEGHARWLPSSRRCLDSLNRPLISPSTWDLL